VIRNNSMIPAAAAPGTLPTNWEERPGLLIEEARTNHVLWCGYPPPRRESARRRALFAKAAAAMQVMVALRGRYQSPITVTAWYGRHGRRLGIFTYYDDDREIRWTPREGYTFVVIEEIPF